MYSLLFLAAMSAPNNTTDQLVKIVKETPAIGRGFAFRRGFGFNRFSYGNAFRFGGYGFRSYGYSAPFVSSYYAAPFVSSYSYAAPVYAAPACAPQAFNYNYGCGGGVDAGTAAAIQELRAAIAELRQALPHR